MSKKLTVSIGQASSRGRKKINQDFYGAYIPKEPLLSSKGIAVAIADGISSSDVSQIASETAVAGFLQDYYCTSDAWSVKTAAHKVLQATNSWLFSQTKSSPHRFNKDKGYICTFSCVVFKGTDAHIFHSGDSRIYRVVQDCLEQLTNDHRRVVSEQTSYLSRALGINDSLDLDYKTLKVEQGDIFILTTDGIYEYLPSLSMLEIIAKNEDNLDVAAKAIVEQAYQSGSHDNLTIQIIRIDSLPELKLNEVQQQISTLLLPPKLAPRMSLDGYDIIRNIYISSRSHVFLALDSETKQQVVIKTPSTEMRENAEYLENFLMEDWIAKRIDNVHVLKSYQPTRKQNYLYTVTEYIEGQTLAQWIIDNPKPTVTMVRDIIEQIAKGLQAFHRQEMVHQDLRPNNIMIDKTGTVKIIDFGSTKVAGISEIVDNNQDNAGTAQFTAPEYFLGQQGTRQSDIFSLGVITYYMLSGKLPYGTNVFKVKSKSAQRKLIYRNMFSDKQHCPHWIEETVKKAVHVDLLKRYQEISEFIFDLRRPNKEYINKTRAPLLEREPVLFWQCTSIILLIIILFQSAY